ncbi:MAG: alpha/beta hydrolase [Elusimicrobia bacterium]|nr:alpha/beta hydrolase [Elusimicrobiota bacterium]
MKPFRFWPGSLDLRIGVDKPQGPIRGDVIYIHGFADQLDNHPMLFEELTKAGFRVISFDLPGHGENKGIQSDLGLYSFPSLASLVVEVEKRTREDAGRPLFIAGWSTGGLLAVRMAQMESFKGSGRAVSGLILYAPGVSVHLFVGWYGFVTMGTLSNNPEAPRAGGIQWHNRSPLFTPLFALRLLGNAWFWSGEPMPKSLPVLMFVGGDAEDAYAWSPGLRIWAADQRKSGAPVTVVECMGARHELDNEKDPVGREVRAASAAFARGVLSRSPAGVLDAVLGRCKKF